ncbi:MAG: helix-turn-helix transcriptional regulator [Clostridia bacterium]|nr:helix-turn-helix transcriptional regulator [Clostridia bacterium]
MDILKEYLHGDIYFKHHITDTPCDADFLMHIHDTCEVYLFIGGDVEYLVEGTVCPLQPESVVIIRPFEAHKTKIITPASYERYVVNFPASVFESIDPERRLLHAFFTRENGSNNLYTKDELGGLELEAMFKDVCYSDEDDYGKQLKIYTLLIEILDALNSAYSKHSSEDTHKSREAEMVAYVNAHIGEDITVPKLAEHFYLSPSQFSRIFKVATGASPWSYITAKRLGTAKERLGLGASVQNAFESSGFGDYSSFYRAYVKYFGNAPTEDAK